MTATRWTLLLLAALAGVAGVIYAMREPAAASGPAVAALPQNLPAAAASEAPANAAPQPAALPRAAATAASAPRIGAEGYGPHIERAQAGNDAQAAWEAVQWLRNCTSTEGRRNSFELLRNQGVSPEMMTQLMVEADAEARRCQTVTAQHHALLPELASRAMRAGVPEAAAAYAAAMFPGDLSATQRQEVADAMRRDALAGDAMSLINAATSNRAWGLSDAERLSFLMASGKVPGDQLAAQSVIKSLLEQGVVPLAAPPTPQQLAAAKLAAQQIVERARAGKQP
jgi:hypothetical protein